MFSFLLFIYFFKEDVKKEMGFNNKRSILNSKDSVNVTENFTADNIITGNNNENINSNIVSNENTSNEANIEIIDSDKEIIEIQSSLENTEHISNHQSSKSKKSSKDKSNNKRS